MDISHIRDTRTGKFAKIPKVQCESESENVFVFLCFFVSVLLYKEGLGGYISLYMRACIFDQVITEKKIC